MPITNVVPLFPKVLTQGKLVVNNDMLTKDILSKFEDNKKSNKNETSFFSTDPYLHNELIYKELSDAILNFVNLTTSEIFQYDEITPEISLMWATVSKKNQNIHRHYHPNSLFSGTYYPQHINYAPIRFYTPYRNMLLPRKKETNMFNTHAASFVPTQGDIFLFPSELEHDTDRNNECENRISIAFNIFIRGKFGDDSILSSLTI